MTTPVIIDAIVVILLVAFVVYGTMRGLLRTLAGLVIVVAALIGAGMAAATFSEPVAGLVTPLVEAPVSEKVQSVIAEQMGDPVQLPDLENVPMRDVLERLGIDEAGWEPLVERAQQSVTETGTAVVHAVTGSLMHLSQNSLH